MKTIDIAPGLTASIYAAGEMSIRGVGQDGQIRLLAWSFSLAQLRLYAKVFLGVQKLPEIEFSTEKKQ